MCRVIETVKKPVHKIIDMNEGSSLIARALDLEWRATITGRQGTNSHDQFRDRVLEAHIRSIHIMRSYNHDAAKMLPTPIHHHQFRYDFPTAVGIPRIARVGDEQRNGFVGGSGRGMIYFRTRREK